MRIGDALREVSVGTAGESTSVDTTPRQGAPDSISWAPSVERKILAVKKKAQASRPAAGSRHVAFLRGINVGKAKRISMADLKKVVEDLGYTDVATLLNSGNVVFTSPAKLRDQAAARIEAAVEKKLGVSSRVTVISGEDLAEALRTKPFPK